MSFTQQQLDNIRTYLSIGHHLGAPLLAIQGACAAGYGENGWNTYGCNSSDHCGTWQLDSSWQAQHPYADVAYWTAYAYERGFYGYGGLIAIAHNHPNWSMGMVAQACQGAGPTFLAAAQYYDGYAGDVDWLISTYDKGAVRQGSSPPPSTSPNVPQVVVSGDPEQMIRQTDFAGLDINLWKELASGADSMAGLAQAYLRQVQKTDYITPHEAG